MDLKRASGAHFVAVFVASGVLMTSIGVIRDGAEGGFASFAGWIGGFLIFLVLSLISLPLGLLLRALTPLFGMPPLVSAVLMGVAASLALIPILHPAMLPTVSWSTHPISLVVAHSIAGVAGGLIWFLVENPGTE